MSLSEMRANLDTNMRYDSYFALLLCADEMMFTYDGLPETVDEKHIEDYLNITLINFFEFFHSTNSYFRRFLLRIAKYTC